MRSLIDIMELSTDEIEELINTALDIIDKPEKYNECCRHRKLATLFFEPSTRTRLSFEAAMLRARRQCYRLLRGSIELGFQGRERRGYRPRSQLLCGHHRNASS